MDNISDIVWTQCLGTAPDERALIISDNAHMEIAGSLLSVGNKYCDCGIVKIEGMKMHGQEPPDNIAEMMQESDIVLAPTTFSITHTNAALKAANNGTRVVTLPGITREMFLRAIHVNYKEMCRRGQNLIKELSGNEIKIETKAGTDLYLRIDGRNFINSCGTFMKPKKPGNLPSGEVFIAPLEGKSEGKIIIDASSAPDSETPFGIIGKVKRPFKISVEKGELVDCDNDVLWKAVTSAENGTNIAEFGIGTNNKAMITGRILEDEKVMGTSHVAFGTNRDFGGLVQASVHLDCVFMKPTVEIDGRIIIREGKY